MSPGTAPDGSGDAAPPSVPDEAAAEAAPGDQPAAPSASEPGPRARARRRRLQALAGVTVHGSDGRTVGRVRDVYLRDATGELAAIAVTPRQLSARSVLIPAIAIAALPEVHGESSAPPRPALDDAPVPDGDHVLHLLVDAATAKAGTPPPLTLHATPQELRAAAESLHLEEGSARA
ncbi:PRC-barrel domain-containing protein [Brachybacterium vulturis]|uniref:PRC-barrel domain-containing protein n=1 Tax=Brachybacterium vulturis TaxID=2017484 RepID=UPI0037360F2C